MTNEELLAAAAVLLPAVRNYLDITWVDDAGDQKLTGIIARGIQYINDKAGAEMDYNLEGPARSLLFDYCRYARSNALDDFSKNYLSEILALQISQEVDAYVEEESADV